MEKEQEVYLTVGQREFKANKELLIEYSDYFRAMFSGFFIEKKQDKIRIDVVDESSMEIILRYMQIGFVDLSDFSLSTVSDVMAAATFLQITELTKQINYCLEEQLSASNWIEIRELAQRAPSPELEQAATTYGLFQFKYMKPEYISTIEMLFWYLSHPYINAESELQVFTFGVKWCEMKKMNAQGLLIPLCCVDFKLIKATELEDMKNNKMMKDEDLILDYACSQTRAVIVGLHKILKICPISLTSLGEHKKLFCIEGEEEMSEEIYNLAVNIVCGSVERKLTYVPAVPMWTYEGKKKEGNAELSENHLYIYKFDSGFEEWLQISQKNYWGWNITNWTPSKIVMCCGEHGRGTGKFMRDVKVYDIHKKEWIQHGVQLPPRRHAGVVVMGDELYILGGVGEYRVVLDTAIVYDLKQKTYRKIAKLPDAIQSPAVCAHENEIYAVGHKHIYKYVGEGTNGSKGWEHVIELDMTPNFLISYNGYIHVAQSYFPILYRFRPGIDLVLEQFTGLNYPPMAVCNIGRKMVAFTCTLGVDQEIMTVEEFQDIAIPDRSQRVLWSQFVKKCGVHATGSCALVLDPPPLNYVVSAFHQEIITKYAEEYLRAKKDI
ncbi:hypothetical protein PYW07_008051 [Mythimna separata]|uniref:BTB domain-containing protein n=1 Tax=Mythimna separata TaxID=271217 RepID=A0AAD7YS16_MYTSE|nr:hypothetical protein PYW07_008051 [Mythimna separata]